MPSPIPNHINIIPGHFWCHEGCKGGHLETSAWASRLQASRKPPRTTNHAGLAARLDPANGGGDG